LPRGIHLEVIEIAILEPLKRNRLSELERSWYLRSSLNHKQKYDHKEGNERNRFLYHFLPFPQTGKTTIIDEKIPARVSLMKA
jgi:hypothetical protein